MKSYINLDADMFLTFMENVRLRRNNTLQALFDGPKTNLRSAIFHSLPLKDLLLTYNDFIKLKGDNHPMFEEYLQLESAFSSYYQYDKSFDSVSIALDTFIFLSSDDLIPPNSLPMYQED